MLGAYIPLGHSSNQVPRSSTHMWHLQALSLRLIGFWSHSLICLESLIRFLETSLMTYFLSLNNKSNNKQLSRDSNSEVEYNPTYTCAPWLWIHDCNENVTILQK